MFEVRKLSTDVQFMDGRQFYSKHKTVVWTMGFIFIMVLLCTCLLAINILRRRRTEATLLESEERMKSALASMDDFVFVLDKECVFESFYQPSTSSGLYVSSEEFLGRSYKEIMPPQVVKIFDGAIDKVTSTGEVERVYYQLGMLEETRCFSANISIRKDGAGRNAGFTVVSRDVTERMRAEESLREQQARLDSIIRVAPTGIGLVVNRVLTEVNDRICEMTGYTREELLGKSARILYPTSEEFEFVGSEKYRLIHEQGTGTVETHWKRKDGTIIDVILSSTTIVPDDLSAGVIFTALDITERKRVEQELLKSEAQYRLLTEKMNDMIWMTDMDLQVTYISPSIEKVLGFTVEERMHQDPKTMMTPESYAKTLDLLGHELEHDQDEGVDPDRTIICEVENYHKDGSTVWTENVVSAIRDETGTIIGMHGVSRDITERKQTEQELQKSEAQYRFLTEKMNDIIWTVDLDFRTTYISPSVEKILGFTVEERLCQGPQETITPQSYAYVMALLTRELEHDQDEGVDPDRTIMFEMENYHKNGSTVWMENVVSAIRDENGSIIGVHGVSRDISRSRKVEMQLRQAQKMEAIGTLAGGIAHDFNNILSAIIGYTELAQDYVTKGSRVHDNLEEVLKAGLRARDLVRQILTFSRQVEGERKPVQMHLIVREALKLLRSSIPTTIRIEDRIDKKSGMVIADPTQIHQVVMNLCTNAYQAMNDRGGTMHVTLERVMIDSGFIKTQPLLNEGPYIKLSVRDTGEGIDLKTLERIFDPFFTTKAQGKGTGLGLATVHGIVTRLQGIVQVDSTPGQGSTFTVYLPCIEKDLSAEKIPKKILPQGQGERILLVDDEASIVQIEKQMLEDLGYIVTTKTDSLDALETFRRLPDQFDLIITDMTMPNLTGVDLSREILQIKPDFPIILCTGFSDKVNRERAEELGIQEYLEKPFDRFDFAQAIHRVLQRSS